MQLRWKFIQTGQIVGPITKVLKDLFEKLEDFWFINFEKSPHDVYHVDLHADLLKLFPAHFEDVDDRITYLGKLSNILLFLPIVPVCGAFGVKIVSQSLIHFNQYPLEHVVVLLRSQKVRLVP